MVGKGKPTKYSYGLCRPLEFGTQLGGIVATLPGTPGVWKADHYWDWVFNWAKGGVYNPRVGLPTFWGKVSPRIGENFPPGFLSTQPRPRTTGSGLWKNPYSNGCPLFSKGG